MKKIISTLTLSLTLILGLISTNSVYANADSVTVETTTQESSVVQTPETKEDIEGGQEPSFTQVVKKRFIEGGVNFMIMVLACLILGIATAIERIIYLSLSNVNTKKVLQQVEEALNTSGVEGAKEVCRNTRGPVGAIL